MEEKITAWIARDKDGSLYLGDTQPKKYKKLCNFWNTSTFAIDKNNFPQVKWKDDEPTKVELTIKICK